MKELIDLHTHSTASDGSMSPQELVRHAAESGLSAVALTDHDTVEGVEDALDEGRRIGLEVVAGLEISVDFKPEMHILAYFFGDAYKNINDTLVSMKKRREERNPKIIRKLNELGLDISMREVEREARGNIVGRPHIARVLVNKSYASSIEDAFDRFLLSGRPAYFKKEKLTPAQGIGKIIDAGGMPVLAHPILLGFDFDRLDALTADLKKAGLKGIEAIYAENSPEETQFLLKLGAKYNLLITGGSDFHGTFRTRVEIGRGLGNLEVPYRLLEALKGFAKEC